MSRPTAFMTTLLTCAALCAPLAVQASPTARWKFPEGPYPLTVLVTVGRSDVHGLKHRLGPPRMDRFAVTHPPQTATGWTQPLGLRIALRW